MIMHGKIILSIAMTMAAIMAPARNMDSTGYRKYGMSCRTGIPG